MRVGVLTGGGDCPGLNAVIRAVTKSLIHQCNAEVIGIEDGYLGLIEKRVRPLDWRSVAGIIGRGGTILGTHNISNPFAYGADRLDVSEEVVRYTRELGLDAVVTIGGDGTQSVAHRLSQMGLSVVGVPKTIDNDLRHTERTFGFDSAVNVVTEAIDRLQTTAEAHHRVMIVETMGRYAGWIALEAGLAGGADVIVIPEKPYDIDAIVEVCQERETRRNATIITIAEGARAQGGDLVVAQKVAGSHDPVRLGGVAHVLREQLQSRLKSEVRATVLGHIQRGGSPTPFDRVLATQFGHHAAQLLIKGQLNEMVTLQGERCTSVPLSAVAGGTRQVPDDHPVMQAAKGMGISLGVRE